LTAAQVSKLDDEISTLYQVLVYALPFVTAAVIAISIAFYRIQSAIKRNSKNIGIVATATNGKVDALLASVTSLHERLNQMDSIPKGSADATNESTAGTGTGSTAGNAGV
jgi:hypothetical protein